MNAHRKPVTIAVRGSAISWAVVLVMLSAGSCRRAEDTDSGGEQRQGARAADTPGPTTSSASRAEVEALKKEAYDVIDRLIKDFPHDPTPHVVMGAVHARFGNGAEAMKCWNKCLEMNPRHLDAHAAMAVLALDEGQYEKAARRWRKAIEIDPNVPGGRVGLGRALMGLGKAKEAVAVLEEKIAATPGHLPSLLLLGKAYVVLGELAKAETHYRAAIAIEGDCTPAYYGLSMICTRLGREDQARRHMEKFRKLKAAERDKGVEFRLRYKDEPNVRRLVGLAYAEAGVFYRACGHLLKAERHWLKAAEFDPGNPVCRSMLGTLYTATGRYAQALGMYKQAVKLSPENAEYQMRLGTLHAQLSQFDEALAALKRAIELDGDNRQYRKIYQKIRRKKGLGPEEGTQK